MEPIVASEQESSEIEHGAALVLEPLQAFLDEVGLGHGPLRAQPLGDGHSNLTFLLRRGEEDFVLRRPPRGDLAVSANDVMRESLILSALGSTSVPVPEVLARCEDERVIGAPFFVMTRVPGRPVNDRLPTGFVPARAGKRIAEQVVQALVDLHSADLERTGLATLGRRSGYLQRQLRRFGAMLEETATRPLPDLEPTASWLLEHLPSQPETTFVHGDFRLGNLMFAQRLRLSAVLDWEMATVGDPLADIGYLTATWAGPGEADNPMFSLSRVTAGPGFPGRAEIAHRYEAATGRNLEHLPWYQILALWKSAIFLEGSFARFQAGASSDTFFSTLERGVPALARACRERVEQLT